jgi:hypothetical protein
MYRNNLGGIQKNKVFLSSSFSPHPPLVSRSSHSLAPLSLLLLSAHFPFRDVTDIEQFKNFVEKYPFAPTLFTFRKKKINSEEETRKIYFDMPQRIFLNILEQVKEWKRMEAAREGMGQECTGEGREEREDGEEGGV